MEILDFVGLKDKHNQRAVTLSTGEKKRLGIARAIAVKPEILFLDEPTASVDTENTRIIEKIILDLKSEKNTVIIMTTHDRSHAEKIADFLLRMENGRLSE
jgi:tungstate transport system ATP-binding protein